MDPRILLLFAMLMSRRRQRHEVREFEELMLLMFLMGAWQVPPAPVPAPAPPPPPPAPAVVPTAVPVPYAIDPTFLLWMLLLRGGLFGDRVEIMEEER